MESRRDVDKRRVYIHENQIAGEDWHNYGNGTWISSYRQSFLQLTVTIWDFQHINTAHSPFYSQYSLLISFSDIFSYRLTCITFRASFFKHNIKQKSTIFGS